MALQRALAEAGGRVPETDRQVPAAGRKKPAVGREGHSNLLNFAGRPISEEIRSGAGTRNEGSVLSIL